MTAKLGADPDELVGELVRAIAQDLADGKSIEKVTEGLMKGGLSREQAAKLVDVVVQARNRHENSAEGRAQKRSHAVSRMLKGALWGGGGAMVTLLSMGSGGGRVFFGAVLYGGYLFISGLVLWGGNLAQLGDDEELKGGPAWLRDVRVGDKVRDSPKGVPTAPAPPPAPVRVITPPPAPAPATPRAPPRSVATAPAAPRIPPRPAVTTPASPRVAERIEGGTTITRVYAVAFLWDQIFGLGVPVGIFGRIGLGSLIPALTVLSIMTFVAGIACAIHVVKDNVDYKFLVLPAYHVIGVLLMFQVMNPVLGEKLSLAHSAIGLIGGLAWIYYTGQFGKAVRPRATSTRPVVQRPVLPRPTSKAATRL